MTVSHDILDLGELLQRLRTVDRNYRVSGSEQHKYRLNPVLSESELVAFESAHRIKLPQDYRCFLAMAGLGRSMGLSLWEHSDAISRHPSHLQSQLSKSQQKS